VSFQHSDLQSLQAQSTGEDSNSSDTVASDAGDADMNGSMDHSRTPSFANSFLSLQNLPGLLPGPSGMPDNFGECLRDEKLFSISCLYSNFINKFNNKRDSEMKKEHFIFIPFLRNNKPSDRGRKIK